MTSHIRSFPPIVDERSRVLVLGSMPGERSLAAGQYYAHRDNLFWTIMGELVGAGRELAYPERVRKLLAHGIAVWDVLEACQRRGSLDSAIVTDSMKTNAFAELFACHPGIRRVFFNGGLAERVFRRRVMPELGAAGTRLELCRLPSTSPAFAAMRPAEKLRRWRVVLDRASRAQADH